MTMPGLSVDVMKAPDLSILTKVRYLVISLRTLA